MICNSLSVIKIGKIIGVGEGRGIALLILIAGFVLAIVGIGASRLKSLKVLERRISKNETIAKSCQEGL